ncbi:YhcU family protein [Mesobacillus jeotgali]|uniref:YhcU family protein n=1 Tax=Mesobacillus jeotgali TaxID=129985 RepID=UPI0009A6FE43|nr:YhcU family protein [Mesobacillus jeotgali]
MKIVYASTPGQEEKIVELANYFYTDIFPLYFTDEDIQEFERLEVLHTRPEQFERFSTLGDAFQVITSMQTLISILESGHIPGKYQAMFRKNVQILTDYGICFPFNYNQFSDSEHVHLDYISTYSKAANRLLL